MMRDISLPSKFGFSDNFFNFFRTRRLPETGRMYAYHDVRHTRLLFFPFHRHG